ncbi:MAG: hypothetical protein OEL56_00645 [Nitrosopumilus sp.]|nr:hypothetical protein [Nitrosopumilus sp.]MDH3515382.1 hypothetical protein [Nitrosopumilus sp.]MDH3564317.1 hypothetical protein [Nitrosopumilus sp.]MDH5417200.1 hypothetical protein [Nitrosopumilus sp.]MDH5555013.1 hypothetical protein [Nitrosopumilus sp.]
MKILLYYDHLRIKLNILEKIGAAKGSFYIPYRNIVSAFSEPPHNLSGFRVAGTNMPKILELGTYLAGTQKQFWYVKKRKYDYLVLMLKTNFYSKIIIESEKSKELANAITEKIEKNLE